MNAAKKGLGRGLSALFGDIEKKSASNRTEINKIPIIGQVITGIEGEGLIGVNYNATGTYENPDYTINPLSILTPGILRSIFDGFLGKEKKDDNTK